MKEKDPDWYNSVEQEAEAKKESEQINIKEREYSVACINENSDLIIGEVEVSIDTLSGYSALTLRSRFSTSVAKWLHYIFQMCLAKAVSQDAFTKDAKVMLPRPGKTDYNTVRSYRPITLESVIGKVMERVITRRLVWKLEVVNTVAVTQNAYRRQKSCVQSVLRVATSLSEARAKGESIVLTLIDYESCFERIWRAGFLHKTSLEGCGYI